MTNKKFFFYSKIFIYVCALLFALVCLAVAKTPIQIENFKNENVQEYGQFWIDNRMSLNTISEPEEYKDVIKMGKSAVPYLINYLSHPKASIRVASICALSAITNKQFGTIDDFKKQIKMIQNSKEIENPIPIVNNREEILLKREYLINQYKVWWKKNKNKTKIQWFIEDLKDTNELFKKNAAIRLGEMKSKKAIPALKEALHDPQIAIYAKEALANINK